MLREYHDGTWLVELEWLSDPDRVADAVAGAIGVDRSRSLPVAGLLLAELAGRQVLLVLDTCEHQLAAVRPLFVDRLLPVCPGVSVLATSLQPLGCEHEEVVPVHSLEVPKTQTASATPGKLRSSPAVRLFLDCLGAATVSDDDIVRVARICSLVDGIPLTILLAAARAKQLGVTHLAGELDRTFCRGGALELLDAGGKLRQTLDWSFSLLADEDRRILMRLSAMVGAFTLDEAKELCIDPAADRGRDVVASLCRLVDCSAVVVDSAHGTTPRYRLLQPVRDLAAAKLDEQPAERARLTSRHAQLYLRVAREADLAFGGADERRCLMLLDDCIGNLRAALSHAVVAGQADTALGLAASLWRYWFSKRTVGRRAPIAPRCPGARDRTVRRRHPGARGLELLVVVDGRPPVYPEVRRGDGVVRRRSRRRVGTSLGPARPGRSGHVLAGRAAAGRRFAALDRLVRRRRSPVGGRSGPPARGRCRVVPGRLRRRTGELRSIRRSSTGRPGAVPSWTPCRLTG